MLASQIPAKFALPWAADAGPGYTHAIPTASQILITPGAASLTDGFPPLTFIPVASGGVFPFGDDFNGILNQISAWSQWQNAGAAVTYDSGFSTAIGGYPAGALITSAAGGTWWLSTVDNNVTDPDTGGAGWQLISYGNVYAGNPNGHVAGVAPTSTFLAPSLLWDTTNKLLWLCTTTGNAGAAVWTQLTGGGSGTAWCGTSAGTANAQTVTAPTSLQLFTTGTAVAWKVGAALTNSGSTTLTVGSFGTFTIQKDSPTGPVNLAGSELVEGNLATGRFDGTVIQLTSTAMGTASLKNTGNTVADPGTGDLEIASPMGSTITGNSHSYVASDRGYTRKRSNSGAAMTDTLPAVVDIEDGWFVNVINTDATAGDTISAPGGVNLNGVSGGSVAVGPLQCVTISFDGAAYWITSLPQPKSKISYIGVDTVLTAANSGNAYAATAAITITFPRTTTAGNGWAVPISATSGNCIMTPNAADSINEGGVGDVYTLPGSTSALFISDGAGNIEVFYQTAVPGLSPSPEPITASQTIAVGQYGVDTSAVPISLTLPASPAADSIINLDDAQGTWALNKVTLISGGGGNTINGSASNFTLDTSGAHVMLVYKSGNWSFQ